MKKKFILLLVVFVTLFTITGCGGKKSDNKDKTREVKKYNSAFFIKEGSNYALFNDSGKQLTDFKFTYAGSFSNGTALVKIDSAYGVINQNGKMVIDFGKYKYVYQEASLYKARDEEGNEFLLNSNGKKLVNLKDKSITTYIGVSSYALLLDKNSNEYQVLDKDGKSLLKFKSKSDDKPTTNEEKNFLSIFNDGKNYIIDLITGKKVLEFEADEHFCVNNASDDGKIITLNSCVGTFQKQDKTLYKFIKDGKLYDLSDDCDKVSYNGDNLVCSKDGKNYLLDSKLKVGFSLDSVVYADNEHYAKLKSGSFNGVDFYENDKVLKNVACRTIHDYGYSKSGLYILTTYYSTTCGTKSGTYEYYNKKGEKAFDKSFASAQKFDSNSLARVSEDKVNYYLIDLNGKKVTDEYDYINLNNDYYIVTKDKLAGVLDNKGKILIPTKYNNIDIFESNGKKYARITEKDSKYTIYSFDSKKEIAKFDSAPTVTNNYLTITKNGKKEYYTLAGKLFYKEK